MTDKKTPSSVQKKRISTIKQKVELLPASNGKKADQALVEDKKAEKANHENGISGR